MSYESGRIPGESYRDFVERVDAREREKGKAIDHAIIYSVENVPETKSKTITGTITLKISVGVSDESLVVNFDILKGVKQHIRSRLAAMLSDRAIEILLEDLRKSSAST